MSNVNNILVTGASGFIGQYLLRGLQHRSMPAATLARGELPQSSHRAEVLIHLAGRAHISDEPNDVALAAFRRDNVALTITLARAAVQAGVKRFVYVSSVKVNGEGAKKPYTESDIAAPQDPYGVSKWEAEQALWQLAQETGLEVVVVRPPLVYGHGVKANFSQMLAVVKKGWPLPLASVKNLRSLVYVENLVDALILCAVHPAAAGQTYLVSDGEDVSTPDLLRKLGLAVGKPACLWPCPQAALRLACRLVGKSNALDKLTGSLQIDSSKICSELGWKPPFSLDDGLRKTVQGASQ